MKNTFVIGDIHGSFKPIRELYNVLTYNQKRDATIICLGDFGANFFFNYRDEAFKKKLGRYGFTYFVIRGNHEQRPSICQAQNPDKWHIEEFWSNRVYVENEYPYIKYAMDTPEIYEIPVSYWNTITTLVLPGAYSVDKWHRLSNDMTWFPYEQCDEDEMKKGLELAKLPVTYDLVLSHTCPYSYMSTDLFMKKEIDQNKVDKSTECWLDDIEQVLDYKIWCWGHFHENRIYPSTYQNKNKVMLSCDAVLDLKKYFTDCNCSCNPYDALIEVVYH